MAKYYLDITKEHCPMTFVKAKLKLEELERGDELGILLADGEPIKNVPRSIEDGHGKILSQEKVENNYLLKVRKK